MSLFWVQLTIWAIAMTAYFWITAVFCFWFIYLVDAMKQKRIIYKTTSKCIQGESDHHQQMLAYNAKTNFVKFVMLFCLNIMEWAGCTLTLLPFSKDIINMFQQVFNTNHTFSISSRKDFDLHLPYFDNVCIVISLAIIGSLCMYLSARFAQKNWIQSKRIPYWICFFLLSSIVAQCLVILCDTYIIGIWCDKIVVTLSAIFGWKQYRKLNTIIQWSIVDLRVSGNIELLERHIRMKRRFNRIFTTFWIGISCIIVANSISAISGTITFLTYYHQFTAGFICDTSVRSLLETESYIVSVLLLMELFTGITGIFFIFIPYIGFGLCTMFVLLWRLLKGKTGYRTHFPGHLNAPLI